MKRINQIFIVLAIGIMALVFSCSKEENKTEPVGADNLSPYHKQVNKTIKQFKKTIAYYHENPGFKSGETVSADSALWLLEATINYSHTFPNEYYDEMQTDDLTLTVPKNSDGTVDMDIVIQKYDEMKADVSTVYNGVTFTDKGLVLVDLTETSQTSTELTINVQAVTGEKGTDGLPGPFEPGDDWWYGEFKGHCPPWTFDSDAVTELQIAMSNHISEQNQGLFFIDQIEIYRKGGNPNTRRENDPNPPDNNYDYYLYSSSTEYGLITNTNGILCLEYNEMNAYFTHFEYFLYTKIPNEDLSPGYQVEKIIGEMEGTFEFVNNNEDIHYYHDGTFVFGKPIGYDEGEGPEEL